MLSLTVFSLSCSAAGDIDERKIRRQVELQGILGNKVILSIDGERHMLTIGQAPNQGVRLLSITGDSVNIDVDGIQRKLLLGGNDTVTAPFKERKSALVSIARDPRGMYTTVGSINGLPVSFLVDTGATMIAMNSGHARRLAVNYRMEGVETAVGTASGIVKGYRVKLDKVTVGEITLRNVMAVVVDGRFPVRVLLGMSFLGELEIQRNAGVMHLKQNF